MLAIDALANKRKFGEAVRAARIAAGLTQEHLAALSGISKSYIGHIENARVHSVTGASVVPERRVLVAILEILHLHLPDDQKHLADMKYLLNLVGYAPPDEYVNDADYELVAPGLFRDLLSLPQERRQLAVRQIAAIIRSLKDEDFE